MNWEHPELSVGRKCEHQPIGLTCYEAIGQALQAFLRVTPEISRLLKDNKEELEKGLPTSFSASFHLFMVAKNKPRLPFANPASEESVKRQTRPTIAIISKSKRYRKRVLSIIKKGDILRTILGFELAGFDRDPAVPVAGSTEEQNTRISTQGARNSRMIPGTPILFPSGKNATLGGYLSLNGTKYGMTAYHASIKDNFLDSERLETLRDEDDDCSECSDDYAFEDDEIAATSSDQDAEQTKATTRGAPKATGLSESLSSNLSQGAKRESLPMVGSTSSKYFSSELDYLVFPIESTSSDRSNSNNTSNTTDDLPPQVSYLPLDIATEPHSDREVWAATSTTGTVTGIMFSNPCFIKMPGTSAFEEMWAIKLDRKALPGDCGAWIFDKHTNELYGHIVAGDPNSCLAYIIPAHKVVADIKTKFGIAPTLFQANFPRIDLNECQGTTHNACSPISNPPDSHFIIEAPYPSELPDSWSSRKNRSNGIEHHSYTWGHLNEHEQRRRVISAIDDGAMTIPVMVVAFAGFITDWYEIFFTGILLGLPEVVHCGGCQIQPAVERLLPYAFLAGSFAGQLSFGVLADLFGRRKLFLLSPVLLLFVIFGLVWSPAEANSMNLAAWFTFCLMLLGVSTGSGSPLSAVMTSEFAPQKHRLKMLVLMLSARPIGQLLIAMMFSKLAENQTWRAPEDGTSFLQAWAKVDRTWSITIAIGVIPILLIGYLRFRLPESPLYTMDVNGNYDKAYTDILRFHNYSDSPSRGRSWKQYLGFETPPATHQSSIDRIIAACEELYPSSVIHQEQFTQYRESSQNSLTDIRRFFPTGATWRYFFGICLSSFLLDFSFYGVGMNHSTLFWYISWANDNGFSDSEYPSSIYVTRVMTLSGIVILVGGAIAMSRLLSHWPIRKLRLWILILLSIMGLSFGSVGVFQLQGYLVELSLFVCLIGLVFLSFGANSVTYVLPAELYPTRYRAACYGITAASGTLGCIIAQVFFTKVRLSGMMCDGPDSDSAWLRSVLLILCTTMAASSMAAWYWIPETRHEKDEIAYLEVTDGVQRAEKETIPLPMRER